MSTVCITLDQIHLHYPAVAYKSRSVLGGLIRFIRGSTGPLVSDIHALRNITLRIEKGQRVGLIGHNGAGKSTLLKVIAGLYPVSSGNVRVDGAVRSLFDLSLGFEPDATGRANILYRGLLLGLSPDFMREREKEIVAFADLGEFIDYPLSTYSTGMQVRLAFAISTFVGGEVLLLDEVIGAGDASFMVKAKARIAELINRSQILILASHDLHALRSICARTLVLHHGELVYDGETGQAIEKYFELNGLSHA